MEKVLSVEERIKKAEEIYNRRKNDNVKKGYSYNDYGRKNNTIKTGLTKKMGIQIIICTLIYVAFYTISNNNYTFSNDFKNIISSILNTQIDFNKLYDDGKNLISEWLSTNNGENVDKSGEDEAKDETSINSEDDRNIGGAEQNLDINEENIESKKEEKNQMEIDADEIKSTIEFEVPVDGHISSTFGPRNPTTSSVPRNHTGLDIAAPIGTVIKSATDGTVILASSNGDYGKHYQIEIGDIVIVYAHCSKLYLKEGDRVAKGQSIAEVGSTGNSTGPHLHFEIRKEGRYVDPQLILDI